MYRMAIAGTLVDLQSNETRINGPCLDSLTLKVVL